MSAIPVDAAEQRRVQRGWLLGLVGVLAFSLTLPMTRLAVAELDPGFVAFGRMALAGFIAAAALRLAAAPRLPRGDLALVGVSAAGIVIGFPLLSTLALRSIPAAHAAIINGALPLATALSAALINHERPSRRFWACAVVGSSLVIAFALRQGHGRLVPGDWWMLAAVAAGAIGYAAGGRLSARIGGVRTILWALALATPLTVPVALWQAWQHPPRAGALAWAGFAYITLVSQLIGFFAWYNGLALGGIARIGQVQLTQVFFTIGFAALLFGESVPAATWWFAAAVVATIAIGRTNPATRGQRP